MSTSHPITAPHPPSPAPAPASSLAISPVASPVTLSIAGLPTSIVDALRAGGPDANGQRPLVRRAEGAANPCRHCLDLIREGEEKLVLAYRPFDSVQPYAEIGPIFLHPGPCTRYAGEGVPGWFAFMDLAIVRGYGADDWIRYETGHVVPGTEIAEACRAILADPTVAYVHVRSKFNCFQCRVDRKGIGERARRPE